MNKITSRKSLQELPLWGVLDKLETEQTQPELPIRTAREVLDLLMPKIEAVHQEGGQLDLS
ncbi:MAG: hypothetical protein EBT75_07315 [Proteobacteria bacterium]|jgi:hypothetical protein|nr:hypothetical protein [Pseudomonadota bacterium]